MGKEQKNAALKQIYGAYRNHFQVLVAYLCMDCRCDLKKADKLKENAIKGLSIQPEQLTCNYMIPFSPSPFPSHSCVCWCVWKQECVFTCMPKKVMHEKDATWKVSERLISELTLPNPPPPTQINKNMQEKPQNAEIEIKGLSQCLSHCLRYSVGVCLCMHYS